MFKVEHEYKKRFPEIGGHNDLPAEFSLATEKEFWDKMCGGYYPEFMIRKQIDPVDIPDLDSKYYHTLTGFVFFDHQIVGYFENGRGKPKTFWRAGCDHDYKETNIGHCLHRWTCKKCKYSREIDSSG